MLTRDEALLAGFALNMEAKHFQNLLDQNDRKFGEGSKVVWRQAIAERRKLADKLMTMVQDERGAA